MCGLSATGAFGLLLSRHRLFRGFYQLGFVIVRSVDNQNFLAATKTSCVKLRRERFILAICFSLVKADKREQYIFFFFLLSQLSLLCVNTNFLFVLYNFKFLCSDRRHR